jgi:predicted ester cyclase
MAEARDTASQALAAFNNHDQSAISSFNAPNIKYEAPGGVRLEGRDAATGYAMGWLNGFPDARLTVHNEVACGDYVVQECTFEGTHTGPLAGAGGTIPATGKKVVGRCVQVSRWQSGLATENRLYFDQVEVLTQLGQMPEPATAKS